METSINLLEIPGNSYIVSFTDCILIVTCDLQKKPAALPGVLKTVAIFLENNGFVVSRMSYYIGILRTVQVKFSHLEPL